VSDGIDRVLVTNDDGIGSAGLEALVERLAESADVTVVAPDENVSGIGRTRSREVTYERTDRGYAVDGTPADCVAFGASARRTVRCRRLGVQPRPERGGVVLGRSGTVGAAVEAAWLGLPAVAVSAYHPETVFARPPDEFSYSTAAAATERYPTRRICQSARGRLTKFLGVPPRVAHTGPQQSGADRASPRRIDPRNLFGGCFISPAFVWAPDGI
jgi:5'/3'-nucleotidase SurE